MDPNRNDKSDKPVRPAQPQPPMPVHLPTGDAEHPHSSPLRQDVEEDGFDPNLPPEPGHDINP
jgi:hypothetical protein